MTIENEIERILRKEGRYLGTGDLRHMLTGHLETGQIRSIVENDDRFSIKPILKRGQRWEIGLKEWARIENLENRVQSIDNRVKLIEESYYEEP